MINNKKSVDRFNLIVYSVLEFNNSKMMVPKDFSAKLSFLLEPWENRESGMNPEQSCCRVDIRMSKSEDLPHFAALRRTVADPQRMGCYGFSGSGNFNDPLRGRHDMPLFVLFCSQYFIKDVPEMKKILLVIALAMLMLITIAACDSKSPADSSQPSSNTVNAQDIGQGSTVFRFEVTDDTEKVTAWNVSTNETTVGEALLAVGLIDGDVSDFGLYVKAVNGLTADYDVNQSWWCFNIDGEMAMAGVDTTDIEQGKVYAFVYTIG